MRRKTPPPRRGQRPPGTRDAEGLVPDRPHPHGHHPHGLTPRRPAQHRAVRDVEHGGDEEGHRRDVPPARPASAIAHVEGVAVPEYQDEHHEHDEEDDRVDQVAADPDAPRAYGVVPVAVGLPPGPGPPAGKAGGPGAAGGGGGALPGNDGGPLGASFPSVGPGSPGARVVTGPASRAGAAALLRGRRRSDRSRRPRGARAGASLRGAGCAANICWDIERRLDPVEQALEPPPTSCAWAIRSSRTSLGASLVEGAAPCASSCRRPGRATAPRRGPRIDCS